MNNCKIEDSIFTITGNNDLKLQLNFDLLLSLISFNNINSLEKLDMLFNYDDGKASFEETESLLKKTKEELPLVPTHFGSETGSKKGTLTPSEYIDSELFLTIFTHTILDPSMDREEFRKYAKKELIKTEGISDDEANAKLDKIIELWDDIKEVGTQLHIILTLAGRSDILENNYKFREYLSKNFESLFNKLNGKISSINKVELLNALAETLRTITININTVVLNQRATEKDSNGNVLLNENGRPVYKKGSVRNHLNFEGTMNDGTKISCHVDKLIIADDGKINIFNYKVSSHEVKDWNDNKKIKYAYETAILLKVLELNGFDIELITVRDVPIVINYNSNNEIDSIKFDSAEFINYHEKRSNGTYITKYINEVSPLFGTFDVNKADINLNNLTGSRILCDNIIPTMNITDEGIRVHTLSWIKQNLNKNIVEDKVNGGYNVIFEDNTSVHINNKDYPTYNSELINIVLKKLRSLHNGERSLAYLLYSEIETNWAQSNPFGSKSELGLSQVFRELNLSKYLQRDPVTNDLLWMPIKNETLLNCNILIFKHKKTGQIDIIVPSAFDLNESIEMPYKHHTTLLGYYLDNGKTNLKLKNTYGDLEAFRAIAVLNDIIDLLGNDCKLGELKIISPGFGGTIYKPALISCVGEFNKIVKFLNTLPEIDVKINFSKSKFLSHEELIMTAYLELIYDPDLNIKTKNNISLKLSMEGFLDIPTKEQKIQEAQRIMKEIESIVGYKSESDKEKIPIKKIIEALKSPNNKEKLLGLIYLNCANFIHHYNKWDFPDISKIDALSRNILPQYVNPDANVRQLANLYRRALDNTAFDFLKEYSPLRNEILKFYEKTGNSSTFMSDPEHVYENMYQKTSDNKKTWLFVNPYDLKDPQSVMLSNEERNILKKILFVINKHRVNRYHPERKFNFTSENDPEFKKYIEEHLDALWVPLQKGSKAHERRNIEYKIQLKKTEINKLLEKGVVKYIKEKLESKKSPKENNLDVTTMSVSSEFDTSETNNSRTSKLNLYDEAYFETNLEYIVADYIEQDIIAQELDKVALYGRTMIFTLNLLQDNSSPSALKCIKETINALEEYMKLNIFGKSIMTEFGQNYTNFMEPARRLMTNIFIMGNIKSALRDYSEGVLQNFTRTITKFGTDLNAKSIIKGYKTVLQDCLASDRDLNIVSELCLRYRLSNVDAAKIAERAKTGKGGLLNPEKYGFSTLRGPDFLNRMTLFAARCKQDGVWDAFKLDENRILLYDWKKDKRFEMYAKGLNDKSLQNDPKFLEQKALYFHYIQQYNLEHPDKPNLLFSDDLPEPYSRLEIDNFKEFADQIYGAYDQSLKATYEHWAIGQAMGVFTTWMNGHIAAWLKKPGYYNSKYSLKDSDGNYRIKKDAFSGNELYFNADLLGLILEKTQDGKFLNEKGEEVEVLNPVPVYDNQDVYSQGIFYTISNSLLVISNCLVSDKKIIEEFLKEILSNPYDRENLTKAVMDLLLFGLFTILFTKLLTPMYKEYKKDANPDDIASNALIELLYKSGKLSYDGFAGPYAAFDYVFNDVKPLAPATSLRIVSDLWSSILGEKTWTNLMYSNAPIFRSFKDTAKITNPDAFKTQES